MGCCHASATATAEETQRRPFTSAQTAVIVGQKPPALDAATVEYVRQAAENEALHEEAVLLAVAQAAAEDMADAESEAALMEQMVQQAVAEDEAMDAAALECLAVEASI